VNAPVTEAPARSRRLRYGLRITALAVAVAVGATAAVSFGFGFGFNGDTGGAGANILPPATATVDRQTLTDSRSVRGELGYGPNRTGVAGSAGTLTTLAPVGATIGRGGTLYTLNNEKVVLLYGGLPAYRILEPGVTGPDVKQFEANLSALGYTGFTVDEEFTWSTAEAVRKWQGDLGLPKTGQVEQGRISYADGEVRVEIHRAKIGDLLAAGGPVLTTTGTERIVTAELKITERRIANVDSEVTVTLPDHTTVPAKVVSAQIVVKTGEEEQSEPQAKIEVTVALDDQAADGQAAALDEFDHAPVDVSFTTDRREDVLTVPVNALLALVNGGYGVEVVDGSSTRIVSVQTGLFADGRVEVTGDGLTEGLKVGVPS
jgi:peptidoglycan hydrolase-like protein with peptidoglycan-binding domain